MVSPPPPYSPQQPEGPSDLPTGNTPSSAEAMSPSTDYSHMSTPLSATTMSPMSPHTDRRTAALYHASVSPMASTPFPPPPPPVAVRSTSRNTADRLLGAMNLRSRNAPVVQSPMVETTIPYPEEAGAVDRPPVTRRAASTGISADRMPADRRMLLTLEIYCCRDRRLVRLRCRP